jgi:hypothetical protein
VVRRIEVRMIDIPVESTYTNIIAKGTGNIHLTKICSRERVNPAVDG